MGAAQFDRQVFLQNKENPPRVPISVLAPLVLAVVVVAGGLLFYKFVIADTAGGAGSSPDAELTPIEEKVSRIEQRLDQIEKRRRALSSEPAAVAKEQKADLPVPAALPPPRTVYRIFPARAVQNTPAAPVAGPATNDVQSVYQKREINALQRDVTAGREEWEATTNRLGNVVGELRSEERRVGKECRSR